MRRVHVRETSGPASPSPSAAFRVGVIYRGVTMLIHPHGVSEATSAPTASMPSGPISAVVSVVPSTFPVRKADCLVPAARIRFLVTVDLQGV